MSRLVTNLQIVYQKIAALPPLPNLFTNIAARHWTLKGSNISAYTAVFIIQHC